MPNPPGSSADPGPSLAERLSTMEDIQRATLNILDDLEEERRRFDETQRATFNILDDLDLDRELLRKSQSASLNILDDLSEERDKTESARQRLEAEVGRRMHAEEEMAQKAAELKRSNEELEQFAYVASHDMQEPLRTVYGAVTRLQRQYAGQLGSDADDYIRFATESTARMQRLIEDLLTFSRVGTRGAPLVPCSSEAALGQTLLSLEASIREAGATVTHDPLPPVLADETQLTQLLQNLIGNAVKFHGAAPPLVHVSAERRGSEWVFSVQDNGIGIDPQYFERIFVIFQRLHGRHEYPGTGVGLAVSKKIVERHGGRIWVTSRPGEGATFSFTLTAAEPEGP